jgi:Flp pilus assembly protein TadG
MINRTLRRFFCDDRGNISTIFSLTLIPVVGLIGISVDYITGSGVKARLDSIADSASLAAVTPALLSQTDQASIDVATTLFNSQAALVQGIGNTSLTVTPQDSGLQRTVTVTYSTTRKTVG